MSSWCAKIIRIIALVSSVVVFLNYFSIFSYATEDRVRVIYSSANENEKRIAITFDDGPHPYYTPKVLDILKREGILATFFVVGENVRSYPELVDRAISEGHEIGNHTNHHTFLSGLSNDEVRQAIDGCDDEIYHHDEYSTRLLRPPGGNYDSNVLRVCASRGYSVVLWSIDTRDWAGTSASDMEKNVLENIKDGDIILMHDYIGKRSHTLEALERIIPKLKVRGYRFVTVSELIDGE